MEIEPLGRLTKAEAELRKSLYPYQREFFDAVIRDPCDHDYHRTPYTSGMIVSYECSKCGDEYEKDVS